MLLADRGLSRRGNRLLGGVVRARTDQCGLCQGGGAAAGAATTASRETLMWTDSETLLHEGVAAARETFAELLAALGWQAAQIDKTFCHQVGRAHRKLLLDTLGLEAAADFTTFEMLGNTGSVALPITAAMGIERGHVRPGDRVAMMGIGSGINVVMLGIDWQRPHARSPYECQGNLMRIPLSRPFAGPLNEAARALISYTSVVDFHTTVKDL